VWLAELPVRFWLFTAGWSVIAAVSYLWVVKMMLFKDRLAKLAERERIARDLHDVLGHTLSLITLKAELAGQLLAQESQIPRARQEIAAVESISRSALAEVRQTIRGYRVETLQMEFERVASMLGTAGIATRPHAGTCLWLGAARGRHKRRQALGCPELSHPRSTCAARLLVGSRR
jgi:hypothetical protein